MQGVSGEKCKATPGVVFVTCGNITVHARYLLVSLYKRHQEKIQCP
jgi:hypothetical protein